VHKKPVRHSGWNVKSPGVEPGLGDNFSGGHALGVNPVQNNLQFKYTFSLSHFLSHLKK